MSSNSPSKCPRGEIRPVTLSGHQSPLAGKSARTPHQSDLISCSHVAYVPYVTAATQPSLGVRHPLCYPHFESSAQTRWVDRFSRPPRTTREGGMVTETPPTNPNNAPRHEHRFSILIADDDRGNREALGEV